MVEERLTRFKTAYDERRFDERYARGRAERWPSPPAETDIEADLGTAHVFSWAGDGTPVLLLPGWHATSAMWAPLLARGLGGRPVHAVDLVGDVGLSVQRGPITTIDDYLPWLDAVVDGLGLDRVHLVGASYGGALSLVWSGHAPDRVATASLVDPVGLGDLDLRRFIVWGAKVFAASVTPMPLRRRLAERLHARMILDADLVALGRLTNMRTNAPAAPDGGTALAADVLRAATAPTLALIAEHSAVTDAHASAERARTLLGDATVEIVPDAGHGLPTDGARLVAARVRRFLDTYDANQLPATG
jgi:pimeloyl-ACP methyl ester carboxylesterase